VGARTPAGVTEYCSPPITEVTHAYILVSADECNITKTYSKKNKYLLLRP
jgi:hypothetical protein